MSDKSPSVDIIITTRNNASTLRNALISVSKQTFLDYRCFVADDCSTDETSSMVAKEFPWVKLLSFKERRGPSHNRNIAAKNGSTPFIVTLDDDIVLTENWLKEMMDFISFSPTIGAVGSQLRSGHSHDILMGIGGFFAANGMGGDMCFKTPLNAVQDLAARPMRIVFACSAAMIMRRIVFEKIGGFDQKYFYLAEDYDLGLRMGSFGYLVMYNPKAVAYHYYHEAVSKTFSASRLDYFYYRNGLCTVLKNFSPVTILSMLPYFLFGTPDKLLILLKALVWNLFHAGHIISSRKYIKKHRKVSDSQILTLNLFLRSSYKYGIVPADKQSKVLLLKKKLENIPFIFSPLLRRGFQEIFPKNTHVANIIFLITNICNAKCKHCFLRNNLNKEEDKRLSLEEIEKFFTSLGRVGNIVVSGGEPFLREDIDKICTILEKASHPRAITIPTNGLASDVVFQKVKSIFENTQTRLIISLSVDGPAKIHDEIRGVTGLFEKVQQTYKKLLILYYMFYPRLTLQVNTTLFDSNYKYFEEIHRMIRQNFPQANFAFEVMRGSYDSSVAKPITNEMYGQLLDLLKKINDPLLLRSLNLHSIALKTIKQKKQIVKCNAGRNFIVVDHLGNLAPCEMLPSFVNIRDIGYNFLNVLKNPRWHKIIEDIKKGKCYCTHMCFLGSSLHDDWNKLKTYIEKQKVI